MRKLILGLSLAALFASGARADFTGKDATGATITFKNSGTCTAVVCVSQHQPVDSTGAAFGVTGNPFFISFATGVTLPAYASTPTFNLGTLNGAALDTSVQSILTTLGLVTASPVANTVQDRLKTINTTLGTPFQAGASIGNTAFGITGAIPAGTNLIGKVGIDQTTPNTTNAISVAQIAGTTTATGSGAMNGGTQRMAIASDSPGVITLGQTTMSASVPVAIASNQSANALWGQGATGAAVPSGSVYNGGAALSSEPTAATTGNLTGAMYDLTGKTITSPYANRENQLRCAVTLTASTSATTCTGMGAQGASVKIYVTDLTCTRNDAGTTAATMTLNDTATTIVDMPNNGGGGGFSKTYNVPLVVAANTAFTVQSGTSLTSVHCSATGFKGY